jgi:preprotein translocase subunit SecG
MNFVLTAILAVQMLTALSMIGLILVQHGKGADMGAAFGSGSSGSLFGASGSANFLSRTTAVLAAVFFACTLLLAYFGNLRAPESGSVLERGAVTAPAPAASGAAAQIPATAAPSPGAGTAVVPAAPAASGAAQIPAR